jgi:simple sugar transport system permease protein
VQIIGEDPAHVLQVMYNSAFGSAYDLGQTLYYTTSLIFAGLAVSIAFHAGLFNIGADGQITVACFSVAAMALLFPSLSGNWGQLILLITAMLAGLVWTLVPALLKIYRSSHEVITTMMMNFVAYALTGYFTLNHFKNPDSQNPETAPINEHLWIGRFNYEGVQDSFLNKSVFLALLATAFCYLILYKTKWGFFIRSTGSNPEAAKYAGIPRNKILLVAFLMSGMLAAMAAMNEVAGAHNKFIIGMSAEIGFVGIAVAMLAQNNPIGIIPAAFLFAFLTKGASDLDLETKLISRDFAKILQGIIILSVIGFQFVNFNFLKKAKHG